MRINQYERTDRLRQVYRELKRRGKVKFNRDFLQFTGIKDGEMSSILKENSARPVNLPIKHYEAVKQHWNITDEFWETGKGKMFNDDPEPEKDIFIELNENVKILIEEIRKLNAK